MSDIIRLKVSGMETLSQNIKSLGDDLPKYLGAAGDEIAKEIIETPGLQRYPATTAANAPGRTVTVTLGGKSVTFRRGYYARGSGYMQPTRGGGYLRTGSSERYGTQFYSQTDAYVTTIGNRASYGPYLGGDDQAKAMGAIGWRKLYDVAVEKLGKITDIYQRWVDKLIHDRGLD